MSNNKIDFAQVRATYPILDVIGQHVALKPDGAEFEGLCPFHGDRNPSLRVVPAKQHAFCMSCGWHGDVVGFVRDLYGVDTVPALRILEGESSMPAAMRVQPPVSVEVDAWEPIVPVPDDAPAVDLAAIWNHRRGRLVDYRRRTGMWTYTSADGDLLGYVVRLDIDGDKVTPQLTYARNTATGEVRWTTARFPRPLPLLGVQDLVGRPSAEVIVVEGEKSRDAAAEALPSRLVVCWPGGSNLARHVNWEPLRGRSVLLWPDADAPGLRAMWDAQQVLAGMGCTIRHVGTDGLTDGFDAADVQGSMVKWLRGRVVSGLMPEPPEPQRGKKRQADAGRGAVLQEPTGQHEQGPGAGADHTLPALAGDLVERRPVVLPDEIDPDHPAWAADAADGDSAIVIGDRSVVVGQKRNRPAQSALWTILGLDLTAQGWPVSNLDTATSIIQGHESIAGRVWYDEFYSRIRTDWMGPEREWSDDDDRSLTLWIQRHVGVRTMSTGIVADAVAVAAYANKRDSLRDWLRSLEWDGVPRLWNWAQRALGVPADPYHHAAGRNWLLSMAARGLRPGCKVDTMPVLYSPGQGKLKSTVLAELAGVEWFGEAHEDVGSKDWLLGLQGKWLVEISEMHSFGRADEGRIKGLVSQRIDRYRPPYARRAQDFPRRCVLAGTTNVRETLRDATGNRRSWPMKVRDIDLEFVRANREQLFAEAVSYVEGGATWWEMPDETAEVVDSYREQDAWEPRIQQWLLGRQSCRTDEVLDDCLRIEPGRQSRLDVLRVSACLRALRWESRTKRQGKTVVREWMPAQE